MATNTCNPSFLRLQIQVLMPWSEWHGTCTATPPLKPKELFLRMSYMNYWAVLFILSLPISHHDDSTVFPKLHTLIRPKYIIPLSFHWDAGKLGATKNQKLDLSNLLERLTFHSIAWFFKPVYKNIPIVKLFILGIMAAFLTWNSKMQILAH